MSNVVGVYEYCGKQRCGKSTLMMCDFVCKIMPYIRIEDVVSNFKIFIRGIKCLDNEGVIEEILRIKRDRERNKLIMFDEVGQELKARGYTDKVQTEIVNFAWQMPKRGIVLMYCSNPGNSADIILRKATWQTIMPRYVEGGSREEDYMMVDIIHNYDGEITSGIKVTGFQGVQNLFDSWQPIE